MEILTGGERYLITVATFADGTTSYVTADTRFSFRMNLFSRLQRKVLYKHLKTEQLQLQPLTPLPMGKHMK